MTRRYTPKTHLDTAGLPLCGVLGVLVADSPTCSLCQRRMVELAATKAEAEASLARSTRPQLSPSFVASLRGPDGGLPSSHRRILARSIDGEDRSEAPRWGSWRGALAAWAAWRDEGVPLASTSSPDRFERGKSRGAAGPRTPPGTEHDLGDIGTAFDRACREAAGELTVLGLSEATVRLVAEARLCGVRHREKVPGRKAWRTSREIPPLRSLGDAVGMTAHQVSMIAEHVLVALDRQSCARVHVAKRVVERKRTWDPRRTA